MVSCTDKPRGAAGSPGSLALNSQNQPGLVILGEGVRRLPASIPATQPVPKPLFCPYGVCCSMRVEFSSLLIIIPMYEAQDRSWPGNHSDQRGSEGGLSSRNPLTHAPGWWESRDGLHRPTGTSRFRAETPPRTRVQTHSLAHTLLFAEHAQRSCTATVHKRLANPIRTQPGLVQPANGEADQTRRGQGLKPHSQEGIPGLRLSQQFILLHLMEGLGR